MGRVMAKDREEGVQLEIDTNEVKIDWIEPMRKGGGRLPTGKSVAVRIGRHVRNGNKDSTPQSCITLYQELMEEMRFQSGDRFMVGDAGSHIALRRTTGKGYASGPLGKGGESRNSLLGTSCASAIKFTSDIVPANDSFSRDEIRIMTDGTILIPKKRGAG